MEPLLRGASAQLKSSPIARAAPRKRMNIERRGSVRDLGERGSIEAAASPSVGEQAIWMGDFEFHFCFVSDPAKISAAGASQSLTRRYATDGKGGPNFRAALINAL